MELGIWLGFVETFETPPLDTPLTSRLLKVKIYCVA
jgi:hypothetical protein